MKTIGNYTSQQQRNFPLDAEGLEAIQKNIVACELIGMLAGDKGIIAGCSLSANGTYRDKGWVWLRTVKCPDGELLPWLGGNVNAGMYIKSTAIEVEAEGYKYANAYVERALAPGVSSDGEKYSWNDFHEAESTEALRAVIDAQALAIAKIKPVPAGVIEMWAGSAAPEGYLMCEGQNVAIAEYAELYAAIGAGYNDAPAWNGVVVNPPAGYFKLPDLRGRFVVGQNSLDNDYKQPGLVGGVKQVQLTTAQLPVHKHVVNDISGAYVFANVAERNVTIDGESVKAKVMDVAGSLPTAGTARDDKTQVGVNVHNTKSAGDGGSHENRPPYYALSYIIKVK